MKSICSPKTVFALVKIPNWTGHNLSRESVLALAESCVAEHQAYAPDLMDELRGMADATGLGLAELVINNGFTDFIDVIYNLGDILEPTAAASLVSDNCTAFLIPNERSARGQGFFGQTWDMHASATPVCHPDPWSTGRRSRLLDLYHHRLRGHDRNE